eukprot:1161108-Pelagomonas_calceolata.AAC.7
MYARPQQLPRARDLHQLHHPKARKPCHSCLRAGPAAHAVAAVRAGAEFAVSWASYAPAAEKACGCGCCGRAAAAAADAACAQLAHGRACAPPSGPTGAQAAGKSVWGEP